MIKWIEVYKGKIPKGDYGVRLINGEDGLTIELIGQDVKVIIDFGGLVSAVRMLEEGIIIQGAYSYTGMEKLKEEQFKNVIYKAENEDFRNEVIHFAEGFSEIYNFNHYILVTMNYSIDVVTESELSISIIDQKFDAKNS